MSGVTEDMLARVMAVDFDAMAARSIEILSDETLQRRMGRAGRDAADGQFNVSRVVPMYRNLYERVMAGVTAPS